MSADSDTPDSPVPPPGRVYEILTPGEILGEYTVESCLTYDIFGSLYRVVDAIAEMKTLFVLPRILSDDDAFLRRFSEFKDKQVRLTHPRILSLGESRDIGGRICFVAESVTGKSLPDHLGAAGIYPTFRNPQGVMRTNPSDAARDFTPEKVRKVAKQVLEALEAAHAQGVLHLNLTPSNMLLLDSGDIKVLGFGLYGSIGTQAIEMLVSAGIPPVSLGPRNVRLNTADVISPEVHLKQDPDPRADIYAFGMSVYWLLTGLKPAANYRPPSGIVPALDRDGTSSSRAVSPANAPSATRTPGPRCATLKTFRASPKRATPTTSRRPSPEPPERNRSVGGKSGSSPRERRPCSPSAPPAPSS